MRAHRVQKILDSDSTFIMLFIFEVNLILIKMNSKEILLREMSYKVGDTISEQTISEKVSQFLRYGNVFLLFEVMSLRKEIERLREEIKSIKNMP
jgi:hypothetical protein